MLDGGDVGVIVALSWGGRWEWECLQLCSGMGRWRGWV